MFAKQTLHVNDPPTLSSLVSPLTSQIVSSVNSFYGSPHIFTKSSEPHIVVYDADHARDEGYRRVEMHTDASDVTFIMALSDGDRDYKGGGTVIGENTGVVREG